MCGRIAAYLLFALSLPAAALQVEGRLGSASVRIGESVQLMLEMDAKPSDGPDLSLLQRDFRILGRQSSSSRSVVNGRSMEQHRLVLTLAPLRMGTIEIAPIHVGGAATTPLTLEVSEAATGTELQLPPLQFPSGAAPAGPGPTTSEPPIASDTAAAADTPVLLEASIEPKEVRVAQQAVLSVRVLMPKAVTGPVLRDPEVGDARLLPLGEDWDRVTRNDTSYQVYERRYALFPREIGRVEIPPLTFEGWVAGPGETGYPTLPVHASSEALTLDVVAAAELPAGAAWLPARDLQLTETGPDTYQVRVGQPLERLIDMRVQGIAAAELPALNLPAPPGLGAWSDTARLWDERRPEGVAGIRRERIRLTANEPGRYALPPVTLSWWDTDSSEWKTASLPARELIALPAGEDAPTQTPLFEPAAERDIWTGTTSAEPAAPDESATPSVAPEEPANAERDAPWPWATLGLGIVWLLTLIAWWRNRRRAGRTADSEQTARGDQVTRAPPPAEPEDPVTRAIEEVRRAYESGEAGVAREALITWAALAIPDQPPGNLALLAKRCREPLRSEILLLEQAFFSPHPLHWERRRLWERLPEFEPLPIEEPASFRRKKPLRRRKTAPDTRD